MIYTSLLLLLLQTVVSEGVISREPRLFLVSSTTSTTILSTSTVCYVQSVTAQAMLTCKKKKRSLNLNISPIYSLPSDGSIQPRPSLRDEDLSPSGEVPDIEAGVQGREGKFLQYWITTTLTSSTTAFTATSSLASLICTPAGYTLSGCPGTG